MMFMIFRLLFVASVGVLLWPFFRFFRKRLNAAKVKLNAAGLPATLKNIFFLEAALAEAERKERDRLLAEFSGTIDAELADAKASRQMLTAGQRERIGSK